MKAHVGYAPMNVFRGYRSDYGAGLGNIFTGLLRAAVPLFAPAVKSIGKTLVSAGTSRIQNIIRDKIAPSNIQQPPMATTTVPQQPPRKRRRTVKRKPARRKRPVARRSRTKADIFSE